MSSKCPFCGRPTITESTTTDKLPKRNFAAKPPSGDLCIEPGGAACQLAAAEKRIAALEAIVAKLPKTADGVSVMPGEDTVWLCGFIGGGGGVVPLSYAEEYVVSPFDLGSECEMHYVLAQNVSYCYSTREAALDQKGTTDA